MLYEDPATAAVSATSFGIKVAVTDPHDKLIEHLEVAPDDIHQFISFLDEQASLRAELTIVGCPYDQWPWRMTNCLESRGYRINWLNPQVVREVMRSMEYWNRLRRLHRARTLAHIHRVCCSVLEPPSPFELTVNWENQVAQAIIKNTTHGS